MPYHKLHEFLVKIDPLVPAGEIHVAEATWDKLKDRVTDGAAKVETKAVEAVKAVEAKVEPKPEVKAEVKPAPPVPAPAKPAEPAK